MSSILGMGNPLLDISAVVDKTMLEKYSLKANDAILYEKEDIFEDLKANYTVEYIAGGATQNSIRVAQWILKDDKSAAYFGCVGEDADGEILAKVASESGVAVAYQKSKEVPTGRCAVLITDQNRSLVTKLDAANKFTVDHLDVSENWDMVEKAKIFYSAGFFITVSPDSMLKVAKHASESTDKKFCVNLSAPFICEFFKDALAGVLEYADVVIGNETEAETFAKVNGIEGTRAEVAKAIAALPYKGNAAKSRTVIITQGADSVIVVEKGVVSEMPVIKLDKEKIVDTNGAGDAFVGGLLAQLAKGAEIKKAIECGLWAAAQILQVSGVKCDPSINYSA